MPILGKKKSDKPEIIPSVDVIAADSLAVSRTISWSKLFLSPKLHCLVLAVLIALCFGRTLTSYFLADDFGEVKYVYQIFHGHGDLLWSTFTGNFLQVAGMNVYRPFLLVSLIIDYVFWQGNPFGYYLTNLFYFYGTVVLLYGVTRKLTTDWIVSRSALAALVAAALFAANPLRCESVSWVVGRVDIICAFYYLLAVYLVLVDRFRPRRIYTAAAVLSFWLALLTKEMAVSLPFLIATIDWFWFDQRSRSNNPILKRLKITLTRSLPFWISLALYFVVRRICLGTFVGGYTAGFGAAQLSHIVARWFDPDTLKRLFLPLSNAIYANSNYLAFSLIACYAAIAVILLQRLSIRTLSIRWFALLFIWLGITALPIFQLWGLGHDLGGSRFYFFLSMPISVFFAIALFGTSVDQQKVVPVWMSTAVATFMIVFFAKATYATDLLWVHAGKEVHKFSQQCQELTKQIAEPRKIAILGIPVDHGGAHMILNGSTFAMMMSPPFCGNDLGARFITFNPIMYGRDELINRARFKQAMASTDIVGPFVWAGNNFVVPHYAATIAAAPPLILVDRPIANDLESFANTHTFYSWNAGFNFYNLGLNPLTTDFLEITLKYDGNTAPVLRCSWNEEPENVDDLGKTRLVTYCEQTVPVSANKNFVTVRLPLSSCWTWYAQNKINNLRLKFSECKSITFKKIALLSASSVIPDIRVSSPGAGNRTGAPLPLDIQPINAANIQIEVNATKIKRTSSVRIEVSKPDFFFDNFSNAEHEIAVDEHFDLPLSTKRTATKRLVLAPNHFYQVRVAGDDSTEYSDPITLRTNQ
jgi:hypothetical protein